MLADTRAYLQFNSFPPSVLIAALLPLRDVWLAKHISQAVSVCQCQNISRSFSLFSIKIDSEVLTAHKYQSSSISASTRCLAHGITVQKTHNPLSPRHNHPSLALKPLRLSFHTSVIDSCWTVSGFPSSNASCECFAFVLLFEQLSAPASSATNNILGSWQSLWLVLLLPHTLLLPFWGEIRTV